jgi:thiamine biosynthesis lipoprotein
MKRRWAVLITLLLALAVVIALLRRVPVAEPQLPFPSFTEQIMSTPISVLLPAERGGEGAKIVFDIFREVDGRMSEWKETSPLSAVNLAAGLQLVEVPDDLRAIIRRGIEIGDLTGGAFDITWAALWGLWDFKAGTPVVPEEAAVRARTALVDHSAVVVDRAAGTVFLPRKGMMIGLGGIAKGTALDRAVAALADRGIDSVLISAGGQVAVRGQRGSRPWRVGIRDPRGEADDHFASIELGDACLATSGDYERFFVADGVRYHHILDPRTGMPSRGLRSATVICEDAELADGLTTAMMILGAEAALDLAAALPEVDVVLVDAAGGIHASPGLGDRLRVEHAPRP